MTQPAPSDATWAAGLLALDGARLGGAIIDTAAEADFLAAYAAAKGVPSPWKTIAASTPVEALTGSLDLAATLAAGRRINAPGLLDGAEATLLVRRAAGLDAACVAALAHALDGQRLLLLAVTDLNDEGSQIASRLSTRLPFVVNGRVEALWTPAQIAAAAARLPQMKVPTGCAEELARAALMLGIASPRSAIQALAVARGVAALNGKTEIDEVAAQIAARLVFAPQAQHVPPEDEDSGEAPPEETPEDDAPADEANTPAFDADAEVLVDAVKAALPPDLLQALAAGQGRKNAGRNMKAAVKKATGVRGRRIGAKRASSLARQRLDVLATLRVAAPWQPLRRKASGLARMVVMRDDFRVARIKQRNEATAIFAVDASGSTAFQRLAEAKGAVEAILAECYVRRDKAALIAFRSKKAEVLLPPTRSLERARRALAGLPGGGGTPLAAALDQAFALALQVKRSGGTPTVVLLTDGRANVTRSGEGTKLTAMEETLAAARLFAAEAVDAMLIDVSPEPQKQAKALAEAMQARYLAMPRANAADIARPVRAALRNLTA